MRRLLVGALLAPVWGIAGCNAVLGIDEYGLGPTDDGSANAPDSADGTVVPDGGAEAAGSDAITEWDASNPDASDHDATTGDATDASTQDAREDQSLDGGETGALDSATGEAGTDAPPDSPSCDAGLVSCGGSCIDPLTSNAYCGAGPACSPPGTPCASPYICVNGTCGCPTAGNVDCNGTCIDPQSNSQHCGAGPSCSPAGSVCSSPLFCIGGTCRCPTVGNIECGGTCIDPTTNTSYCGAAGNCQGTNAGTHCPTSDVCSGGQCALVCQTGLIACGSPPTCIDPSTNNTFCGASGNCAAANQGTQCPSGYVCSAGHCVLNCQTGTVDCQNSCINPQTNNNYCGASLTGACSVPSTALPPSAPTNTSDPNYAGQNCAGTAGYQCVGGACLLNCPSGQVACGSPPACIDPTSNPNHCGATGACSQPGGPVTPGAGSQPPPTYGSVNFAGYACGASPPIGFGVGYACVSGTCQLATD
jgi:hypothetical protein